MNSIQKIQNQNEIMGYSRENLDLIKNTVAKFATDTELQLFLYQAKKTGLDPLSKQIYFNKYTSKKTGKSTVSIITGIDGYRLIADRTGAYAGNDDPIFNGDLKSKDFTATCTVWKIVSGQRVPFTATARWSEYCPSAPMDHMWQKMPHTMLGKCAESLALRKAFPAELSGIYTKEEMDQAKEESNEQVIPKEKFENETKADFKFEVIEPTIEQEPKTLEVKQVVYDVSQDERKVTQPQLKRLFAISKDAGWDEDRVNALVFQKGFDSRNDLTRSAYEEICNAILEEKDSFPTWEEMGEKITKEDAFNLYQDAFKNSWSKDQVSEELKNLGFFKASMIAKAQLENLRQHFQTRKPKV